MTGMGSGQMATSASYWGSSLQTSVGKGATQCIVSGGVGDTVVGDTISIGGERAYVSAINGSTVSFRNPLWFDHTSGSSVFTGKVDVTLSGLSGVGRGWRYEVQWQKNGNVVGREVKTFADTRYSIYTELNEAMIAGFVPEIAKQILKIS